MNNYTKILEKIFERPEYHFHIRELAKETNLHPNTVISITNKLEKEGIVKKNKRKVVVEVYCDVESQIYKRKKQVFNLNSLYSSGLIDFLIDFFNMPRAIVLIGSFLRGEDFSKSDIDIAVILNKKEKQDLPDLRKYEKLLKRNIHLLVFDQKNLALDISREFLNNLINGFILYGYLEYDRF